MELRGPPVEAPILEEPTLTLWQRRALSIPGLVAATHSAVMATPLALFAALARDALRRDPRAPTARAWAALVANLVVHEYGLAKLSLAGLMNRGDSGEIVTARAKASYAVECELAQALVEMLQRIYGVKIEVEGQDVLGPDPNIILARHQSLLDPVLLMALAAPRGVRVRYVSKKELLWDPCIDILGHRFPMAFVQRKGRAHDADVKAVKQLVDDLPLHEAVLVFPEGTRFSPEKKQRALTRLREKYPELAARAARWPDLLPPHLGGVLALLEHDSVDEVVVCAFSGLEGLSHMKDFLDGALIGRTLKFKFWRVPRKEVPKDREGRIAWLYDVFDDMNAAVAAQTGRDLYVDG